MLIRLSTISCQLIGADPSKELEQLNQFTPNEKVFLQKALSFQEIPTYNRDSANFYLQKTIDLLKNNRSPNAYLLAQLYRNWCDYDLRNFNFLVLDSLANTGWQYAEKLEENTENQLLQYSYLVNWTWIRLDLGDLDSSIVLFTKALSKVENDNSEELIANISMNKARFYTRYNLNTDRELSFQNLHQSLAFYERQNIEQFHLELFTIYKTLIGEHSKTNSDSVFYYLEKVKTVLIYNKNPLINAWYFCLYGRQLNTIPAPGEKFVSEGRVSEAEKNILKALEILREYDITHHTIEPYCYGLLADIYQNRGDHDKSITYYKKSFDFYTANGNRYSAGNMLQYISASYEKHGNLDSALNYYKAYYSQSVAFEQEKNQRSMRESELQINVLKRDKVLQKKEEQTLLYTFALAFIVIMLGFLFYFYKKRQARNLELQRLNIELESKNKQNELLLKEIHHRVKNNLELVKSLISLQSAQIEDPATKEAMMASQNRVQSMGIIHQKLYQGTNLGSIEMKDYFLNLSEGILDTFNAEEKVKIECAMENLELDVDTAVPIGLIVNELLTNALKYAFPKNEQGTIHISLEKTTDNNLKLKIRDNGVGKVVGLAPKGTGFGAQLVQLLTQQLNGKMQEHNNKGTHIEFDFLIKKSA